MYSAKIIADSISKDARIITMEIHYPRFLLPQINTHRVFSRNSQSSRAIPTSKLIEETENNPIIPQYWGKNKRGMQADVELAPHEKDFAEKVWKQASKSAALAAFYLNDLGVHKQTVNRLLEPFTTTRTLITATEWENFFTLRLADDAQPEIQYLARLMKEAMDSNTPTETVYHLPYITDEERAQEGLDSTKSLTDGLQAFHQLAQLSAARCARISYLNHDSSEPDARKDKELAKKLYKNKHLSPFEHQAFKLSFTDLTKPSNFTGWNQYRVFIDSSECEIFPID